MTEQLKEIGMRLTVLREICGFSSAELAEKLEVSEEQYLTYERGEGDVSFSLLYNAAAILGVDVLDLLSGDSPRLSVCTIVRKGQGFAVNRNKAYDYKHLAFTFKDKKAEPLLVTADPGDREPKLNSHEGQEFNYVISGKMKFFIEDSAYELSAGDSIYFDSTVPHAQQAADDRQLKFIAVVIK